MQSLTQRMRTLSSNSTPINQDMRKPLRMPEAYRCTGAEVQPWGPVQALCNARFHLLRPTSLKVAECIAGKEAYMRRGP